MTNGVNGILVPQEDPPVLAKAVIQVLNDKELGNRSRGKISPVISTPSPAFVL